jgi:hypothetical protein
MVVALEQTNAAVIKDGLVKIVLSHIVITNAMEMGAVSLKTSVFAILDGKVQLVLTACVQRTAVERVFAWLPIPRSPFMTILRITTLAITDQQNRLFIHSKDHGKMILELYMWYRLIPISTLLQWHSLMFLSMDLVGMLC